MPFNILVTSDIHLGKSSAGVRGAGPDIAVRHTWKRIVDTAISGSVDMVALGGDIVDRDDRYFEAVGQLQAGFDRLKQAGIEVIMIAGNHDFDVTTDIMAEGRFDHVTLLGANGTWEVVKRQKGNLTVQFAGWSFPSQHFMQDPSTAFDRSAIDPQYPVIGLLHAEVGNRESRYGPVDVASLAALPVNCWILGHVHKPTIFNREPLIFYPGSPQALSAKEQGPHGPVMLTVSDNGEIGITPIALSPVRYEAIKIDVTGAESEAQLRAGVTSAITEKSAELKNELEAVSYLVYDVTLTGTHPKIKEVEAWLAPLLETDAGETGRTTIQVRKLHYELRPAVSDLHDLARQPSPAGRLADAILAMEEGRSTPFIDALQEKWMEMARNTGNALVYQPLRNTKPGAVEKGDQDAGNYILNECNRLLGELLAQQENN
jgi:DNA repair protein SbcD/Mre11